MKVWLVSFVVLFVLAEAADALSRALSHLQVPAVPFPFWALLGVLLAIASNLTPRRPQAPDSDP